MKFSVTAAAFSAIFFLSSTVKADSSADAIAAWCNGLNVTTPLVTDVVVAGNNATITVTRVPDAHNKTITGLDLYTVNATSQQPSYVKNVWAGQYALQTSASLQDTILANTTAGLYYYRVWVTNMLDGQHGPDCLQTSPTFKVTTGAHTNAAGVTSYDQTLDDASTYHPELAKGCFGLTVDSPAKGSSVQQGSHATISLKRDSASQIQTLKQVELYKDQEGADQMVATVFTGSERLGNVLNIRDHISIPQGQYDADAVYYYKFVVTSEHGGNSCNFQSGTFKITQ